MPQTLSTTSATWLKNTGRFFTRGRSQGLQDIDTAFANYEAAKPHGWNSQQAEDALDTLAWALDKWTQTKGVKANGNIASCRDSKGLVTSVINDVAAVLVDIRNSPLGRQRAAKNMHAESVKKAVSQSNERQQGTRYAKTSGGVFRKAIYTQEQDNSCTCACACTFAAELTGIALREDVFRATYSRVNQYEHDFNAQGTYLPLVAAALQDPEVGVDAAYVPAKTYQELVAALRKATKSVPVMFVVSWGDGTQDLGAHAVICQGTTFVSYTGFQGPGFLVEDPWPEHEGPVMHDDGTYWVYNTTTSTWSEGYADASGGYIMGKPSRREAGPMTRRGVKVM